MLELLALEANERRQTAHTVSYATNIGPAAPRSGGAPLVQHHGAHDLSLPKPLLRRPRQAGFVQQPTPLSIIVFRRRFPIAPPSLPPF